MICIFYTLVANLIALIFFLKTGVGIPCFYCAIAASCRKVASKLGGKTHFFIAAVHVNGLRELQANQHVFQTNIIRLGALGVYVIWKGSKRDVETAGMVIRFIGKSATADVVCSECI